MSPKRRPHPLSDVLQWQRKQTEEGFHYDRIGFYPGWQRLRVGAGEGGHRREYAEAGEMIVCTARF